MGCPREAMNNAQSARTASSARHGQSLTTSPIEDGEAVEVDRSVSRVGLVFLAGHQLLAAEILGGR